MMILSISGDHPGACDDRVPWCRGSNTSPGARLTDASDDERLIQRTEGSRDHIFLPGTGGLAENGSGIIFLADRNAVI